MDCAWTCHFDYVLVLDGKAIAAGDAEDMAAICNSRSVKKDSLRLLRWYEWLEWQTAELRKQQKEWDDEN